MIRLDGIEPSLYRCSMTSLDLVEHRFLVALYITKICDHQAWLSRDDLHLKFNTDVAPELFQSIVLNLKRDGLVKASQSGGVLRAKLPIDAIKTVLARILATLNAETFEIHAGKESVMTDAEGDVDALIPTPRGWMTLTCGKEDAKPAENPKPVVANPVSYEGGPAVQVTQASSSVGRDLNVFIHSPASSVGSSTPSKGADAWTRWGVIIGGAALLASIVIAVLQSHGG